MRAQAIFAEELRSSAPSPTRDLKYPGEERRILWMMQDDVKSCGGGGERVRRDPPTSVSPHAVDTFLHRFLPSDVGWEQAVAQLQALLSSSTFVRDVAPSAGVAGGELWSVDKRTGFRVHLLVRHGVVRDVLADALVSVRRESTGQTEDADTDDRVDDAEEVDLGD